ncbi:MAG TPA: AI-2E family transporter [Candidatus Eremiobacteraeota bacterium]|nr:MAG: AI-2 transport protein TqsA [bacterium ADurb.Bin363]HPZ09757.1 AI-2E family transporter [Candidatus Eremiobacteraeota bacterium]
MEDKHFSRLLKLIPTIIAIVFVLTLFLWLTLGIRQILSPTILTVILITILIPFKEENRTIKILIGAILFLYIAWFVYLISSVLIPFAIAMILAYIFDPVVTFFERKGISRTKATLILMGLLLVGFAIILLFIIPALIQEISGFIGQIPHIQAKLIEIFNMIKNIEDTNVPKQFEWIKKISEYEIPQELKDLANTLIEKTKESIPQVANRIWSFLTGVFSSLIQFILSLISLIIIPILTFYMLKEMNNIKNFAISLVPEENKPWIISICQDINKALASFLRGQLLVASFVGICTAIGLYFIGIKFSLFIGLLAGISNMVPYLGAIVAITPTVLLALFTPNPIMSIILVILMTLIISFLENSIVSPKILGDSLELNPLLIMLAILIGGQLYGAWGMLLAIPCTCVLKVLFDRWYKNYKSKGKKESEAGGTDEKPSDIKNDKKEQKEPEAARTDEKPPDVKNDKEEEDVKRET